MMIMCFFLMFSACAGTAAPASAPVEDDSEKGNLPEDLENVAVVYFSATGTTKGVAEKIAKITGADLFEIIPEEPYTEDDLNYGDKSSRTSIEQNDKSVRPMIRSDTIDISGYSAIYIGYPIWWGEEPRIMDAFVENYDFTGITVIPFCTSGSSSIGKSESNLEGLAGTGTWLEGKRFSGSTTESELQTWIDGLK